MKINKLKQIINDNIDSKEYYVVMHETSEYNIRFSNNRVISNRILKASSIEIITIIDKKTGVATTDDLSEQSIINCIKKSHNIALQSEVNSEYMPLIENEQYDDSDNTKIDFKKDVSDIETFLYSVFNKDPELRIFGFITGEISNISVFNSSKLFKRTTLPRFSYSMNIKNEKLTRSVWRGAVSSVNNIQILKDLYEELLKDYSYTSIRKKVDAGRYNVVLSPSALGDLLLYMLFFLSAVDADDKKSPFTGLLGTKVFPDNINLYTDPNTEYIKSLPFLVANFSDVNPIFDIGASLSKKSIIEKGILKGLISTRYYDNKMNYKNNIFPVSNLILEGSDIEYNDFIKNIDNAIYINNLWYIRGVDPITGLLTGVTRDGVYKIAHGKIVYSMNNFRFNQSPLKVLANIEAMSMSYLSCPREFGDSIVSNVICPYTLVKDFNLSSVSKAI